MMKDVFAIPQKFWDSIMAWSFYEREETTRLGMLCRRVENTCKCFDVASHLEAKMTQGIDNGATWMIEDEKVVSRLVFQKFRRDWLNIVRFYTIEEYQGKGIGTGLMERFLLAADNKRVNLELTVQPFTFKDKKSEEEFWKCDLAYFKNHIWQWTRSERLTKYYEGFGFYRIPDKEHEDKIFMRRDKW